MSVLPSFRAPSPRPIFCIITAAHASFEAAEDACEGRYTECGQTLHLGIPPNWRDPALPEDVEWRISWHKLYVGLDLAHALEQTGDVRYREAWRALLASFIAQVAPTAEPDCHVVARRVLNTLYAWDRMERAGPGPALSPSQAAASLAHLWDQVTFIRHHLTPTLNHRTIELTALVLAALAFPDMDPEGELLGFALDELEASALSDVHSDGVHVEASTHYHALFVRNFMAVRVNAARYRVAVPAKLDERLLRAAHFLMHATRPDGSLVALSDSDTTSYRDVLELAAAAMGCEELAWAASDGAQGRPPPCAADFPKGGYHVQRSHWRSTQEEARLARHLVWDCGPLGAGVHGHYDALHFDLSAGGRALVVDPGRYTYAEGEPNWRHHFKGTAAHNTVTVDGLDQCDYHPWNTGQPPIRVSRSRFLGRWHRAGLDLMAGEVHSPCYDAVHRRLIAMIDGAWWVVVDRLEAPTSHHYALRLQLTPESRVTLSEGPHPRGRRAATTGLRAIFLGGDRLGVEEAWVAPKYGVKHPAPRLCLERQGSTLCLVTLLLPMGAPKLDLREANIDDEAGTGSLRLRLDGVTRTLRWRATEAPELVLTDE